MVIVWRLRVNIIRTALCWIVWHNVHSPQHTYVSSSYRSNRLGLSHWDPYAVRRGGCLELYYCKMVEWFWWASSLISTTNWLPSVLWHCWFGHLACKNRPRNDLLCVEWDVKPYTLTHYEERTLDSKVWTSSKAVSRLQPRSFVIWRHILCWREPSSFLASSSTSGDRLREQVNLYMYLLLYVLCKLERC